MPRAFGLSFATRTGVALFVALLIVFVFAYHELVRASIERNPETTRRAVREHCRYVLGKQAGEATREEVASRLERCDDFRIASVEAAGGVRDPVMVRITLDPARGLPLDERVLIFRTAALNFSFLSGLYGLATGSWLFNSHVTYSDLTFRGSF